jgi:hypothetical protein
VFEQPAIDFDRDLDVLVGILARVGEATSNANRVDQLDRLERVKAAVAAAQARVTAAFLEEEYRVAAEWRERAQSAADESDSRRGVWRGRKSVVTWCR